MTTHAQPARGQAEPLGHYRDDGPLARSIGPVLARALHLPVPVATALAGVLSLLVLLPADPGGGLVIGGVAVAVLLAATDAGRGRRDRLAWLGPPLLRGLEYAVLIRLGALAGAAPAVFALLGALAFCHYDTVYRLRHQREPVPGWATALTLGWDGRLLLAALLYAAGVLAAAAAVAAAGVAVVRVSESVRSWVRYSAAERPTEYADQEEDEE